MSALRRLLLTRRRLAMWLVAVALFAKMLVPTGYMLSTEGGRLAVVLCGGVAPKAAGGHGADMRGMAGHHGGSDQEKPAGAETPCAFSGLSFQSLAAADPIQLAAALLFILALAFRPGAAPAVRGHPRARPPSHGPPAFASTR